MRVAVFTETFLPKIDGIVRVVCLLLDHLHSRGIETVVVAPRLGTPETYITDYNGSPVITIPGVTFPLYRELKISPPTPSTYQQLKAFNPDVAHFIHPVLVGTSGMVMAKYLDVPTLTSFHLDLAKLSKHYNIGFMQPVVDKLTKQVFNRSDYSLAPSRLIQREMQELGIKNVGLWKRGVDGERFNPNFHSDEMRYQMSDGNPDDVLLLYTGRLSNEKKIHQIKAVLDALPHTRLALVGDGPARDNLKKHFAGTKTVFMGYMTGEALSQAYASADIFVFPSALETFGLVVVEAMAAGLPAVSSRVGGIPDVLKIGETGYLFDVGDSDGLVEGVRKIAADRETIKRMGQNARDFAATQTWDVMMDEVIEHYRRLIDEHHINH
ncbi:MAG: glycosyltransferase family 4 protein [Aggregatilineales bacterium]